MHGNDSDSYMMKQLFEFFASFLLLITTLSVFLTPLLLLLILLKIILRRASLPSVPPNNNGGKSLSSVPTGGEVHSLTSSLFFVSTGEGAPVSLDPICCCFFLVLASRLQALGTAELMASVLKSRGGSKNKKKREAAGGQFVK